jgi:hypothetical protein
MGLRRPAAGFLLMLHLALIGGWFVHAVVLRPDPAVAHLASGNGHDGAQPHNERDCQLCQTASQQALPATIVTSGIAPGHHAARELPQTRAVLTHRFTASAQPRAPPPTAC